MQYVSEDFFMQKTTFFRSPKNTSLDYTFCFLIKNVAQATIFHIFAIFLNGTIKREVKIRFTAQKMICFGTRIT